MARSYICFDTAGNFTYSDVIADTNGGVNMLGLKKPGSSALTLGSANCHTGPTEIRKGTVAVDSINSVNCAPLVAHHLSPRSRGNHAR